MRQGGEEYKEGEIGLFKEGFIKVVSIHNYLNAELNKIIELENVISQPRESVRLLKFLQSTMKIKDAELICDKYDKALFLPEETLPEETNITRFNQQNQEDRFKDDAKETIDQRLGNLKEKARNSKAKWKIIVVAFTGHGFINYPAKESCVLIRSSQPGNTELNEHRFINVEDYARQCASQANTITIIIDNCCRCYPEDKHNKLFQFIQQAPAYVTDTNGRESLGLKMPGIAVLLFAAKKTKSATDDTIRQVNTGTDNFISRVAQSIEKNQFGLEFLNLYPEGEKIVYSNQPVSHFKEVKLFHPFNEGQYPEWIGRVQESNKHQIKIVPKIQLSQSLKIHQYLNQQYQSRWQRNDEIKTRQTVDYPVRESFEICNYSFRLRPPTQEAWDCEASNLDFRCMSIINDGNEEKRPEMNFYECICKFKHKICEACYVYYQKMNMNNNSEMLGKVLVLPRPKSECLIYQFHMLNGLECYSQNHPSDRLHTAKHFSMTATTSKTNAFFPTVVSLDKRFTFAVGGCQDKAYQPGREVLKNNLVLIDSGASKPRIMFKKDLYVPVIHPACSIFDKKLLFIAGGMNNNQWISLIQIFDIEKCQMHKTLDKQLETFGDEPLVAPSLSAEYFDSLGLVICGQNLKMQTELRLYSSKNNKWITANSQTLNISRFSNLALKLFADGEGEQPMQLLLMGGINYFNKEEKSHSASLYRIIQRDGVGIQYQGMANIRGTRFERTADHFPLNQWVVFQDNAQNGMPESMNVLGRNGIYNVALQYEDNSKMIDGLCITWANDGFNKNFKEIEME